MSTLASPPLIYRFASFELDTHNRELRKEGRKIRLPEQPMQVLEMLLERRGNVVTREELKQKLWPDVNVGDEQSLNAAVGRLRGALGDDADNPRFIGTTPKRGYRLLVEVTDPPAPVPSPDPDPPDPDRTVLWRWAGAGPW